MVSSSIYVVLFHIFVFYLFELFYLNVKLSFYLLRKYLM